MLVPVQIGAHATATVVLDERKVAPYKVDWTTSVADEAVQGYLADSHADPSVAAQLKVAWEIRHALGAANEEREKLASEQNERRREAEETRSNLKALERNTADAALRAKLTGRLAEDSARLDVLAKTLLVINARIDANQARFADAVRAIDLPGPPSEAVPVAEAAPFVAPATPRSDPRIQVVAGTWGQNCHAPYGNVTSYLQEACNYKTTCDYPVTHDTVPDPAGLRQDVRRRVALRRRFDRVHCAMPPDAVRGLGPKHRAASDGEAPTLERARAPLSRRRSCFPRATSVPRPTRPRS